MSGTPDECQWKGSKSCACAWLHASMHVGQNGLWRETGGWLHMEEEVDVMIFGDAP